MASRIVYGKEHTLKAQGTDKVVFACGYKYPNANSDAAHLFAYLTPDMASRLFEFVNGLRVGIDPREAFKISWPETEPGETVETGASTDGQTEGGQGEGLIAGSGDAQLGVDGERGEGREERGGDEFQPATPSNAVSIGPYFFP